MNMYIESLYEHSFPYLDIAAGKPSAAPIHNPSPPSVVKRLHDNHHVTLNETHVAILGRGVGVFHFVGWLK